MRNHTDRRRSSSGRLPRLLAPSPKHLTRRLDTGSLGVTIAHCSTLPSNCSSHMPQYPRGISTKLYAFSRYMHAHTHTMHAHTHKLVHVCTHSYCAHSHSRLQTDLRSSVTFVLHPVCVNLCVEVLRLSLGACQAISRKAEWFSNKAMFADADQLVFHPAPRPVPKETANDPSLINSLSIVAHIPNVNFTFFQTRTGEPYMCGCMDAHTSV